MMATLLLAERRYSHVIAIVSHYATIITDDTHTPLYMKEGVAAPRSCRAPAVPRQRAAAGAA